MRSFATRRGVLGRACGLLVGALALPLLAVRAAHAPEKHPHIEKAIEELKEAKKELKAADHDFGGHKVAALAAVDSAIEQLEKCLKADKK